MKKNTEKNIATESTESVNNDSKQSKIERLLTEVIIKINLVLRLPAIRKQNKSIAREAESKGKAESGIVSASVKKFKDDLDVINSHDQGTRALLKDKRYTFPLEDGWRGIREVVKGDFDSELYKRLNEREILINNFLSSYEDRIERAKESLGEYFDEKAYPPSDIMRSKMNHIYRRELHIGKPSKELVAEIEKSREEAIEWAKCDMLNEVSQELLGKNRPLTQLIEGLAKGKDCRTRSEVVDKLRSLASTLRSFNHYNLPEVEDIASTLVEVIPDGLSSAQLRTDETARRETMAKANKLAEKINQLAI